LYAAEDADLTWHRAPQPEWARTSDTAALTTCRSSSMCCAVR
jgi:hypothetical protein